MDASQFLGPSSGELEFHHMLIRALLTYFISLLFFRIAGTRTLGKMSLSDHVTVLMIGAILGRAIVTSQPYIPSMGAVLLIVLLHRLLTWWGLKSPTVSKIIKGDPIILFEKGKFNYKNIRHSQLTKHDIEECMRMNANITTIDKVKSIVLERSGEVSIVKNESD